MHQPSSTGMADAIHANEAADYIASFALSSDVCWGWDMSLPPHFCAILLKNCLTSLTKEESWGTNVQRGGQPPPSKTPDRRSKEVKGGAVAAVVAKMESSGNSKHVSPLNQQSSSPSVVPIPLPTEKEGRVVGTSLCTEKIAATLNTAACGNRSSKTKPSTHAATVVNAGIASKNRAIAEDLADSTSASKNEVLNSSLCKENGGQLLRISPSPPTGTLLAAVCLRSNKTEEFLRFLGFSKFSVFEVYEVRGLRKSPENPEP
ncbi:hypothetical protein AXF42_Ash005592 [Apostasia shenzhenica]|uniref:Uncharacterized protein n=1 Tax=Apostasia shenzhenica TaxID=1088818 RepID=A0A2I0BBU4_9ASPA|nr:hypothetical protein AXF42_Ash005592 [Apostasia shenzhenica]